MTRVLLVGKGPPDHGGIPSFLEMVLSSGLADRHDIAFVNLAHDGTPAGGRLSGGNLRRTASDARTVWRSSRGRDAVHIHTALAPLVTMARAGLLALAGRLRGCTVVVHAHGGRVQLWLTSSARRLLSRVLLSPAHVVVAVSAGGSAALEAALGPRRVRFLPNGVDTEIFRGPAVGVDPPRVLYVGLLTPRKGVIDLLRASSSLRRSGVAHTLTLVGGTPDEGPAAEAEVRAAIGPDSEVLGPQPLESMPELYRAADVFCLPSWWEAAPLSVLEAMASGLPVVATRVGDVARLVEDGVTGLLVAPRQPEALAEALARLLTNPALRTAMGREGRHRAERSFPAAATLAAIDRLYTQAGR